MPDLIERGHLFIAQPPLFKVKRGKKEFYLKNEGALDNFVIQSATEEMKVTGAGGEVIEGSSLREVALRALRYNKVFSKLMRRGDERVLDAVIRQRGITAESLGDEEQIAAELGKTQAYLEEHHAEVLPLKFILEKDEEYDCARVICETRVGGAPRRTLIDSSLLSAPEFNELRQLQGVFQGYGKAPFRIESHGEQYELSGLEQLMAQVEALGRKGLQIQRYKGLGEMNAHELAETTMMPDRRSLLKVVISDEADDPEQVEIDAREADRIFSILMGDDVDARRQFIETNALNVKNLDI
jgi:DNA gyrase subunit B